MDNTNDQKMNNSNYHNAIQVMVTPSQVFEAITQRIPEWWSKNYDGLAENKGDEFTVRFGATFKTMRITGAVRDKSVEWLCVDQHIETPPGIEPLKDKREWVGTSILWEIESDGAATALKHTHHGLTPAVECWAICEQGWDQTLQSIVQLLTTGTGRPFEQLDDDHLTKARQYQARL